MRRIKLFVIGVVILVAFLCLITIFLPSKITITRWTVINANEKSVASQINSFKNWKNWYPAFQNNGIKINISQLSLTPFVTLTNNKNGKNVSLSILESLPENIKINVLEETGNTKTYEFVLLPNSIGQTQLTWNINIELGSYPWKKFGGIFLDKISGPQYEAVLQNLKKTCEKTIP